MQLPQMHFLTLLALVSQCTHLNSCFVNALSKENSFKILLLRGRAKWATNFCSRKIKNVLFWCFFECAFWKHRHFIHLTLAAASIYGNLALIHSS